VNIRTANGYVLTILSGFLLLAGSLLVILQAQNRAEFSLYGKNISIRYQQDGEPVGGVNTGLLMLCSAGGGIAAFLLARMLVRGIRLLRQGWKQADAAQTARRLEQLAKTQNRQDAGTQAAPPAADSEQRHS